MKLTLCDCRMLLEMLLLWPEDLVHLVSWLHFVRSVVPLRTFVAMSIVVRCSILSLAISVLLHQSGSRSQTCKSAWYCSSLSDVIQPENEPGEVYA